MSSFFDFSSILILSSFASVSVAVIALLWFVVLCLVHPWHTLFLATFFVLLELLFTFPLCPLFVQVLQFLPDWTKVAEWVHGFLFFLVQVLWWAFLKVFLLLFKVCHVCLLSYRRFVSWIGLQLLGSFLSKTGMNHGFCPGDF